MVNCHACKNTRIDRVHAATCSTHHIFNSLATFASEHDFLRARDELFASSSLDGNSTSSLPPVLFLALSETNTTTPRFCQQHLSCNAIV